ncbi:oligopeptide ABC transporter ATPase [Erysipelotrichaceae bacterium]|nr:oligopeptide ABC transporter ATPase [Erysipelotrichaceae bacterium]
MAEQREVVLKVQNLKQYFKVSKKLTVKAVDDVSFEIYRGETFGLVGESGSGKSTTGRTIIRLYKPTDGYIEFLGKDISGSLNTTQKNFVSRNMQMIFQDPMASLNPRMKVSDIIAEGLRIHKLCTAEEEKQKVIEILEIVGLNKDHANRFPHEFSGGQRQRIGIARALIMDPEFIIADEAISALDVSIQAQVVNLLKKLQADRNLTYLFIAHDLSMVKYISDRIAVMHHGQILELADADELYDHPLHPYTKSLLSAIPLPNPEYEKRRKRLVYNPQMHDYEKNPPIWHEHTPGHFVLLNEDEIKNL